MKDRSGAEREFNSVNNEGPSFVPGDPSFGHSVAWISNGRIRKSYLVFYVTQF